MSRRGRIVLGTFIALTVVAAIILGVLGASIACFGFAAIAAVAATGWAFYEIGAAEDRDRREGKA